MDWAHLHLALNHIPILGTPFLLGLLLWSWARRQAVTLRFALWLFVVLAAVSIAIKFTGDFAAETVGTLPGFDRERIERHEQWADRATTSVFFLGLAAGAALWFSRGERKTSKWWITFVALQALATCAVMTRTANSGGHIRHPEIRPGPAQGP